MSELSEHIQLVFNQQHLLEQAEKRTAELDAQAVRDEERFIVSLGK